jgi:hypothetical protein
VLFKFLLFILQSEYYKLEKKMMPSVNDSIYIAENDDLRSNHIRELVQEKISIAKSFCRTVIPKIIVQFWHDLNDIPNDVQDCLDSWAPIKNQGFKIVLYDNNSAREFISKGLGDSYVTAFERCHHPAMKCDYFRLCYILTLGGFYVDADEIYQGTDCNNFFLDDKLKIQPLCYDTATGKMIKPDVFIRDHEYSPDWIFYVNNNPLIAPAYHPVIRLALDRATSILLGCLEEHLEIQSTTGPGNLSASLVRHSIDSKLKGRACDFLILPDWESTSISPWPLSYRNDKRNWRLWNSSDLWKDCSF